MNLAYQLGMADALEKFGQNIGLVGPKAPAPVTAPQQATTPMPKPAAPAAIGNLSAPQGNVAAAVPSSAPNMGLTTSPVTTTGLTPNLGGPATAGGTAGGTAATLAQATINNSGGGK